MTQRICKNFILLLGFFLLLPAISLAYTASGTLAIDETWSGEILLTGDITIPEGITLTIDPGARVLFPAGSDDTASGNDTALTEILVSGSLVANGTVGAPIEFTSDEAIPAKGDWGGIHVTWNSAVHSLLFAHCTIEYASSGVNWTVDGGSPNMTVSDSVIQHISGTAFYLTNSSLSAITLTLTNTIITDVDNYGCFSEIAHTGTTFNATISGNTISDTGDNGIYIYNYGRVVSDLLVSGNTIHHTGTYGIHLYSRGADAQSLFSLLNNTLYNSGTGIYVYNRESLTECTISNNHIYQQTAHGIIFSQSWSRPTKFVARGNTIHNNGNIGIYIPTGYVRNNVFFVELTGNEIYENDGAGVQITRNINYFPVVLSLNTIRNNTGRGVLFSNSGVTTILYNNIHDNGEEGIKLYGATGNVMNYNSLQDNAGNYALLNANGAEVSGRYNYWGASATIEMDAGENPKEINRIYDYYDSTSQGLVEYSSWSTSPIALPTAPLSHIHSPADGSTFKATQLPITGIAVAANGVKRVEVSPDGGANWHTATGEATWSYDWNVPGNGTYTLLTRVVDNEDVTETPGTGISVTIDNSLPTTSGVLSSDETWSGVVTLTGDLTVPAGVTLTIDPGTTIRAQALYDDQHSGIDVFRTELIVEGNLSFVGTVAEPITFTSAATNPAPGDWYGIRMVNDGSIVASASLTLTHCHIQYSVNGVHATSTNGAEITISFAENEISDASQYGLFSETRNSASTLNGSISNNIINNTGSHGIYIYSDDRSSSDLLISGNTIHDLTGDGIYLYPHNIYNTRSSFSVLNNTIFNSVRGVTVYNYNSSSGYIINGNEVYQQTGAGVDFYSRYNYPLDLLFTDNAIHDNGGRGVYIHASDTNAELFYAELTNNEIFNNNGEGVYLASAICEAVLTLNSVHTNTGTGVDARCNSSAVLLYNDIHHNGGVGGLNLYAANTSIINYNTLQENTGTYAISNGNAGAVNAHLNYWGVSATAEMDGGGNPKNITRLFDSFDDAGRGTVDYADWLSSSPTAPTVPLSEITSPLGGSTLSTSQISITGIAVSPYGVKRVEVSPDGGINWYEADGGAAWNYTWTIPADGTYQLLSRAIDNNDDIETWSAGIEVTIDRNLPTTSGLLPSDETWSGDVTLTGDVTVPVGVTLTVEAGSTIHFEALSDDQNSGANNSRAELIVEGTLLIAGTAANPVILTSTSANPAPGDWYGIRMVSDGNNPILTVSHCRIQYCTNGIHIFARNGSTATLNLTDSEISETGSHAIHSDIEDNGTTLDATLTANVIFNTVGSGMYFYTRYGGVNTLLAEGNTIHDTTTHGIYIYSYNSSSLTSQYSLLNNIIYNNETGFYFYDDNSQAKYVISGNDIYDHTSDGLYFNARQHHQVDLLLSNNVIHNNGGRGLYIYARYVYDEEFSVEVVANEIYANGGAGIYIYEYGYPFHVLLGFNSVYENGGEGIYCDTENDTKVLYNNFNLNSLHALANASTRSMDGRFNYWGAANSTELSGATPYTNVSFLFDIHDDTAKGKIAFKDWLPSEFVHAADLQSIILDPEQGSTGSSAFVLINGLAYAASGIDRVEVTLDNGVTWQEVSYDSRFSEKSLWSFETAELASGSYTVKTRVVDNDGAVESNGSTSTFSVDTLLTTTAGELQSDETWSGSITIEGDVTVPVGTTLTVLPGTVIQFPVLYDSTFSGLNAFRSELIVHGALIMEGTAADPIVLQSVENTNGQAGDWHGIRAFGFVRMENVIAEHGIDGLDFQGDTNGDELLIEDSTFRLHANQGISVYTSNDATIPVTILNSSIHDNGSRGIYLRSHTGTTLLTAELSGNSILNNGEQGISCYADGNDGNPFLTINMSGNTISGHSNQGIYCKTDRGAHSDLTISGNSVDSSGVGVELYYYQAAATGCSLAINGNTLTGGIEGISVSTEASTLEPSILNNDVSGHSTNGIHVFEIPSSGNSLIPSFTGNRVYNNTEQGILVKATAPVTLLNNNLLDNTLYDLYNDSEYAVTATENWWGTTTTNEMTTSSYPADNIAKIYDFHDDPALGQVDYTGWLTENDTPAAPTLDPVTSPVTETSQLLTGGKEADTAIDLSGQEIVSSDAESTWSYTLALVEGRNYGVLTSRSVHGMSSSSVAMEIVRDTTAPYVYSSLPADGETVKQPVTKVELTVIEESTAIDAAATLQNATVVDGNSQAVAGVWSSSYHNIVFTPDSPMDEGEYFLTLSPTDTPIGNQITHSFSFVVDRTVPAMPVAENIVSPTNVTPQSLSGSKEVGTSVWLNGAEIVPVDAEISWGYDVALTEGENVFSLHAIDAGGNSSPQNVVTIVFDQTAPVLESSLPVHNSFIKLSPSIVGLVFTDALTAFDGAATLGSATIKDPANMDVPGTWSTTNANTLVFSPTAAFIEGLYTIEVAATDTAGNSATVTVLFTFDTTPPGEPVVNAVSSPTLLSTQTLSGSKDADSSIWINGGEAVGLDGSTSWSYQVSLEEGNNTFTVSSKDLALNESSPAQVEILYDDTAPLPVPLSADGNGNGTTVALDWSGYDEAAQSGVAGYRIYMDSALFTQIGAMTPVATVTAGTFHYQKTDLTTGDNYYFAVVAYDTANNALQSVTPVSAIPVDGVAPEEVTNLQVSSALMTLDFSWTHSANSGGDLEGYNVYFNGATTAEVLAATENSYAQTGLLASTAYPFVIKTFDANGNESDGQSMQAVTLLNNPVGLVATPFSGYVDLSWGAVLPADLVDHYAVYVSDSSFSSVNGMSPAVTSVSLTAKVAGLSNDTQYFFVVTTSNLSGGELQTVTPVTATPLADQDGPEISNVQVNSIPLVATMELQESGLVSLTATDPAGMSRVEFRFDSVLRAVDSNDADGYSWEMDIMDFVDGVYPLEITAYDTVGNSTSVSSSITLTLMLPPAPSITSPENASATNSSTIHVQGTTSYGENVLLYNNSTQVAGPVAVSASGVFDVDISLEEGENRLQAAAVNRAGTGPLSAETLVTVDTTIPNSPTHLAGQIKPAGRIKLSWMAPASSIIEGYNVYRADSAFSSIAEAEKLNITPFPTNAYDDATPADANYFYRVSAVDSVGNESVLSHEIEVQSDRAPPVAETLQYESTGPFDEASGRMGPGIVNVTLTVSEELLANPFLTITPNAGIPISVSLRAGENLSYTGSFVLSESTPSGTAYGVFSARDLAGNRGTEILTGTTVLIDTDGPEIVEFDLLPISPVQNDENAPVDLTVIIGFNEAISDTTPFELSYLLSGNGRSPVQITSLQQKVVHNGHVQTWQGFFTLPADAGLVEAETLHFIYSGVDDLGNQSSTILCANQFQVYQGDLPPLAIPEGFNGKSLADGEISLSWELTAEAEGYVLYRQAPGEAELTEYQRLLQVGEYLDAPQIEGSYVYTIASLRSANEEEAISGQSASVTVQSDATPPAAPSNLALELVSHGVKALWQHATPGDVTFNIYRSDSNEILSVDGLTPIYELLSVTNALDSTPSSSEHCYAVTAVDASGNESVVAPSAYLNVELLPVSTILVTQQDSAAPVISWSHTSTDIAGYNFSIDDNKINTDLFSETTYTDTGYGFNERHYTVVAVDTNDAVSMGRSLLLPKIEARLISNGRLKRGQMNRMVFLVENHSAINIETIQLTVEIESILHNSAPFSIAPNQSLEIPVIVGGYTDLPDTLTVLTSIDIQPRPGERVQIIRSSEMDVINGMAELTLIHPEFVRGGTADVSFTFGNSGDEEIEIITAQSFGTAPSDEIRLLLVDVDGNVLSFAAMQQSTGDGLITFSNGATVARIPAEGGFTSGNISLPIPENAPDEVILRLEISALHFHTGFDDSVTMQGVQLSRDVSLVDTGYYGAVDSVTPALSSGDELISITGHAVQRLTGDNQADVSLNLILEVDGFQRTFQVFTLEDGTFTYEFSPMGAESGTYSVYAVHPDLTTNVPQGEFVIRKVIVEPELTQVSIPRNYERELNIQIKTGTDTELHNLKLVYAAADQAGAVLPAGVHLTTPQTVPFVGQQEQISLPFTLWADNNAGETAQLVLKVVSDEVPGGEWATITLDVVFTETEPLLSFTPGYVETGVLFDDTVTEVVVLGNTGSAPLKDITLELLYPDGSAAPNWVALTTTPTPGDIDVGEQSNVGILFSPASGQVAEGVHSFILRLASSNYETTDINVFVSASQNGIGAVHFKVENIYTATLDANDTLIQGLAGAKIWLQNEKLPAIEQTLVSDDIGEALFSDLTAGSYKYRVSAPNHRESTGRLWIKPGLITTESVFLDYSLVTVEWKVVPIEIEDRYEIVLNTTYETNVPAAVVIMEPGSISLPDMQAGDVHTGEIRLTNYGLIRADKLRFDFNGSDQYYKYELLTDLPDTLGAKESITLPYKITCLKAFSDATGSGGRTLVGGGYDEDNDYCAYALVYKSCSTVHFEYTCENGTTVPASRTTCTHDFVIINAGMPWCPGGDEIITFHDTVTTNIGECEPEEDCEEGDECCKIAKKGRQPTGSYVDLLRGDYSDDATDLILPLSGFTFKIKRFLSDNKWSFTDLQQNLSISYEADGSTIDSISKEGVAYKSMNSDKTVFSFADNRFIYVTMTGFLWEDTKGRWIRYTDEGVITASGDNSKTLVNFIYDEEDGSLLRLEDGTDTPVLWFEYDVDGNITAVEDLYARRVSYDYLDGKLVTVTDLLDNESTYAYDFTGRFLSKTSAAGHVTNISYNEFEYVDSVTDENGQGTFFEYGFDEGKNEFYSRTTTRSGKVKEAWYDSSQRLLKTALNGTVTETRLYGSRETVITDSAGNKTFLQTDEWGNILKRVHPDGSMRQYEYDPESFNTVKEVDERGSVTLYEYNANGKTTRKVEAAGTPAERITEFTYNDYSNLLTYTQTGDLNTEAAVTTYGYDSAGNMITVTGPEGNVRHYTYDVMGNIATEEDPDTGIWQYEYDALGRRVRATDPLGQVRDFVYDNAGNKIEEINPARKSMLFEYDRYDKLTKSTDFLGNSTLTQYNLDGEAVSRTDATGRPIYHYEYDRAGRVVKLTDGEGNETSQEYFGENGSSSCPECTSPAKRMLPVKNVFPSYAKEYEYDVRGRRVKETNILSQTEQFSTMFSYDPAGNVLSVTDGEERTSTFTYDALGRKSSSIDPLGNVTRYSYDDRDNMIGVEDAHGNVNRFEYDRNDHLIKEIRPLGQETSYSYGPNGKMAERIDAAGRKSEFIYNLNDLLVEIRYYSSTDYGTPVKSVTFAYNFAGRVVSYDDGTTSGTYTYDDAQRRLSETIDYGDGAFSLTSTYEYLANGKKKSFTGPDNITYQYSYNGNNQFMGMEIPGNGSVTVNSYEWLQAASMSYPGGSRKLMEHDPMMRPQSVGAQDPAGNLFFEQELGYDGVGNLVSRETPAGSDTYRYDNVARLAAVESHTGNDELYQYDMLGNRISSGEVPVSATYNENSELLSHGDSSFQTDASGNISQNADGAETFNYFYDESNHLSRVEDGAGDPIATYYYDPFGRRLWKEVAGVKTYFFYADEGLVAEYNQAETVVKTYGYKPGSKWMTGPLFMKQGSSYYYYQNDHLGTPLSLIDSNGLLVWQAEYSAFGQADIGLSAVENNLRLPGQYHDAETGLHHNYYRDYDPAIGRYLQPDPIGVLGTTATGKKRPSTSCGQQSGGRVDPNLYPYAASNPLNVIDPYGDVFSPNMGAGFCFPILPPTPLGMGLSASFAKLSCCDKSNVLVEKYIVTGCIEACTAGATVGSGGGIGTSQNSKVVACPGELEFSVCATCTVGPVGCQLCANISADPVSTNFACNIGSLGLGCSLGICASYLVN